MELGKWRIRVGMRGMGWECGCRESAWECGESSWKYKKCEESGWKLEYSDTNNME